MKYAALVTPSVLNSPLKSWIESKIQAPVEWFNVANGADYIGVFKQAQNLIAWNCRMPHDWMRRNGHNVLYVENSLISQGAGLFADHRGFFSQSNLCKQKTWTGRYRCNPEFIAKRDFGWEAFSGGNPQGPVLVALQCRVDCNVKMEFPAAKDAADKIVAALEMLQRHLPRGKTILIRPHPRERASFETGGVWRDDWLMDEPSSFRERLPACSAVVTINSTCASEAALLGVPTATLGTGAFTGSGVTLECADDPSRLATLFSFQPDLHQCRAYCSAILGRHFLPYGISGDRNCLEFENWLAKSR